MPTYSGNSWHYSAEELREQMPKGVSTLLNLYALATPKEMEEGIEWYPEARREAVRISQMYALPLDTVILVASAMSPKCPWENNMANAEWVIRQFFSGCFIPDYHEFLLEQLLTKREGRKVYLARIANLPEDAVVLAEDERISAPPMGGLKASVIKALWILQGHDCLSGPKVNDFCLCIKEWETYLGACIDSHAIQGWMGSFDGGTYGIPESFYSIIRADYIRAASLVGLSPLQFQAVLWLVKKRVSKERGRRSNA